MPLAITFSTKPRIGVVFVDGLAIQVGEPRLNVSAGHKHGNSLAVLAYILATFCCSIIELLEPRIDIAAIAIDDHNQRLLYSMLPRSIVGKLLRKSRTHKLLSRPTPFRADFNSLNTKVRTCTFQEPPCKSLVLPILADDDHLNVSTHFSHPLAITSDSFIPPSTARSCDGLTTVTPELSRFRTNPRSPPR